jgi:hypothetical protein
MNPIFATLNPALHRRIIDWNRDRNSLIFDPNMEIQMLSEEAREFMLATNLVDRLHEYCDFIFVAVGTFAKLVGDSSFGGVHPQSVLNARSFINLLKEFIQDNYHMMDQMLLGELATIHNGYDYNDVRRIIDEALTIVVEANEAKPLTKTEGKVIKGPDYVSPRTQILGLLRDRGWSNVN